MTLQQIHQTVESYVQQAAEGMEIENQKCDFKSEWYDLSKEEGINEFLKDTSAIVNTYGPDGLIVIGYNIKSKTYHDATFKDSKLTDSAKIIDLINRRIDRLFPIDIHDIKIKDHSLSVIHIPPSLDKPHVIRNYKTFHKDGKLKNEEEHKVFIRKGTTTRTATKSDYDLMEYDKKNILPEYKILTSYHQDGLYINIPGAYNVGKKDYTGITAIIYLTLENRGLRSVAINEITLSISIFEDPREYHKIKFISAQTYKKDNIVIPPNQIFNSRIEFTNNDHTFENAELLVKNIMANKDSIKTKVVTLRLSDGNRIQSELIQISDNY